MLHKRKIQFNADTHPQNVYGLYYTIEKLAAKGKQIAKT